MKPEKMDNFNNIGIFQGTVRAQNSTGSDFEGLAMTTKIRCHRNLVPGKAREKPTSSSAIAQVTL